MKFQLFLIVENKQNTQKGKVELCI